MHIHILANCHILWHIGCIPGCQLVQKILRHLRNTFIQYSHQLMVTAVSDIHTELKPYAVYYRIMEQIRKIIIHSQLCRIRIDISRIRFSFQHCT